MTASISPTNRSSAWGVEARDAEAVGYGTSLHLLLYCSVVNLQLLSESLQKHTAHAQPRTLTILRALGTHLHCVPADKHLAIFLPVPWLQKWLQMSGNLGPGSSPNQDPTAPRARMQGTARAPLTHLLEPLVSLQHWLTQASQAQLAPGQSPSSPPSYLP